MKAQAHLDETLRTLDPVPVTADDWLRLAETFHHLKCVCEEQFDQLAKGLAE